MSLAPHIQATCRVYFGRIVTRGTKRQLVDNRCDSCPLRAPCLKFGGAPARTFDELDANRKTFADESLSILNAAPVAAKG